MKKMLFLMLFLLILGAANVTSQVRIGGNGQPNGAAVLDLNATDAINNGTKGLALPRVSLSSNTVQITSGTPNLSGMLVYNTNTTLGAGVYYWNGSNWVKVMDGSFVEGDAIVGNELTDTIANGGLTKSGAGTAADPYKVGIKTGGVTNDMIAYHGISLDRLFSLKADSGRVIGSDGSMWYATSMTKIIIRDLMLDTLKAVRTVSPSATNFLYPADSIGQLVGCNKPGLMWGTPGDEITLALEISNAQIRIRRRFTAEPPARWISTRFFCYVN